LGQEIGQLLIWEMLELPLYRFWGMNAGMVGEMAVGYLDRDCFYSFSVRTGTRYFYKKFFLNLWHCIFYD
jgi:hypothetical protein